MEKDNCFYYMLTIGHIPASLLLITSLLNLYPRGLLIIMTWHTCILSESEVYGCVCVSPLSCRNWPLFSAAPPASWLGRRSWCCSLGCLLSSCPQREHVTGHITVCLSSSTPHHNQLAARSHDWYSSGCIYMAKSALQTNMWRLNLIKWTNMSNLG